MNQPDWEKAPEGATHYLPVVSDYGYDACWYKQDADGQWRGCNAGNYARAGHEPWSLDCDEVEVFTRYLIKRPATEWSGAGRPTAGTVCEFREYCGTWAECTIIGEFKGRIICGCNATGSVGYIDLEELRTIRTPEQIADAEREAAIAEMMAICSDGITTIGHGDAALLYDAGLRFK